MKVKIMIDGIEYIIPLFKVEGVNLSINVQLENGAHELTNVVVLDDEDNVLHESSVVHSFTLSPTFPYEIPIEFIKGKKKQSLMMKAVATPTAPVYLKLPGDLTPPEVETHNAKLVGVLGVPDADFHFYENDDFYRLKPIASKIKLRFAVHVFERGDDGVVEQDNWFMYNWGEIKPLDITWNKPKDGNTVTLVIQMYYAFTNDNGEQHMADVNTGITGSWAIHLEESEEPIKDAEGFTHISFMPNTDWVTTADYKFYYPVYTT
jgi:hypothetical protein